MKKTAEESADRARKRIETITRVLAKVSVPHDKAVLWDKRRQRLEQAVKILTKGT